MRSEPSPADIYANIHKGEVWLSERTHDAVNALHAQGFCLYPAACDCCGKPIFYFLKRSFPRTKREYDKLNEQGMRDEHDYRVVIKSDQSLRLIREKLTGAGWKCEN
jgi:hypothetical protein